MFRKRSRRSASIVLGGVLVLVAWGVATSHAESRAARIEGAWMGTLTTTEPAIGAFKTLITLIPRGGVVASGLPYLPQSSFGPILGTIGHGEWKRIGHREFQITFVSLLQGAPDNMDAAGVELGTDNFSLQVTLNHEGSALRGSFEDVVKNLDGKVVFATIGTYKATRISAEP